MVFKPAYILILLLTIVIDYVAGILIEKSNRSFSKVWLIISIITNVGILVFFKYFNFLITNINGFLGDPGFLPESNIILPIGLSFHTFQAMSYTIEVYRKNQKAEKNFGIYALYVMFYPQLVAGPIERPQNLLYQFHEVKIFDKTNLFAGLQLMIWGLFKKVVIADRLAILVDEVYKDPLHTPFYGLLLALLFFSFQIYCDFSGYSDIARGSAQVMGFKLMENFRSPYLAKTLPEFWSRWHISLSTWFRDYVYIPLGGNRTAMIKWLRNTLIVFLLSGIWHGADWSFVLWGLLHGLIVVMYTYYEKTSGRTLLPRYVSIVLTFCIVSLIWVFFRSANLHRAIDFYTALFNNITVFGPLHFGISETLFSFSLIGFLLWTEGENGRLPAFNTKLMERGFYLMLLLMCYFFGIFNNASFIYFQF